MQWVAAVPVPATHNDFLAGTKFFAMIWINETALMASFPCYRTLTLDLPTSCANIRANRDRFSTTLFSDGLVAKLFCGSTYCLRPP